jgi:hypothetical protein
MVVPRVQAIMKGVRRQSPKHVLVPCLFSQVALMVVPRVQAVMVVVRRQLPGVLGSGVRCMSLRLPGKLPLHHRLHEQHLCSQ